MSRFNNGSGRIFGGEKGSFIESLPQGVYVNPNDEINHTRNEIIYGENFDESDY